MLSHHLLGTNLSPFAPFTPHKTQQAMFSMLHAHNKKPFPSPVIDLVPRIYFLCSTLLTYIRSWSLAPQKADDTY